jgi:hypothetical protein
LRCRGLNRRRDGLSLPGRIGHRNRIGRVVDDDGVVNVVVDEVVRRRRNVLRWIDVHGYRHINRNRKNVFIDRRRWRSQIDEEDRPRRQEKYRRRRWWFKSEIRIVKNQYWPFDVDHLFGRRRRYIVGDDVEARWRVESGRQICQPAPCIVGMGATGVTTQIRPVSGRRIDTAAASPRDRFAAGCNNCSHASCHRIVRISGEKVLIVLQIVAIESCEIGFLRAEITDRPRSDRRRLFRRNLGRRRIRRPLKEVKRRLKL